MTNNKNESFSELSLSISYNIKKYLDASNKVFITIRTPIELYKFEYNDNELFTANTIVKKYGIFNKKYYIYLKIQNGYTCTKLKITHFPIDNICIDPLCNKIMKLINNTITQIKEKI